MSISQWIENRKKLIDTKNVLVMKYHTLGQGGEEVVGVAL